MAAQRGSRFDFDKVADSYDRWYETPTGALYDRLEKEAVGEFLPPASLGDRLLEVGSGTGHWAGYFVEQGFRVTGLDCSPPMVRAALGKGMEGADFLVADAGAIPFADGSFDVVAAITVLEFATAPGRVLSEMARCARPGGSLVIGALNRDSLLGLRRRLRPSAIFGNARMLTVRSIESRLRAYGRPRTRVVAFVWPRPAASLFEWVGRRARLPWGDFIVATCRVDR